MQCLWKCHFKRQSLRSFFVVVDSDTDIQQKGKAGDYWELFWKPLFARYVDDGFILLFPKQFLDLANFPNKDLFIK